MFSEKFGVLGYGISTLKVGVLLGTIFVYGGEVGYADENIISMNINGQVWKTENIDQNIIVPVEGYDLYGLYIGGSSDLDGFSIRIELDQQQLQNPVGPYPIYSSYSSSKSGQVYLLPNFNEFSYYNEGYGNDSQLIGYLVITAAELGKSTDVL